MAGGLFAISAKWFVEFNMLSKVSLLLQVQLIFIGSGSLVVMMKVLKFGVVSNMN